LRCKQRSCTHVRRTANSATTQPTPLIIVNDGLFNVPAALQTRAFHRGSVRPSSGNCGQVSRHALHCTQRSTQPLSLILTRVLAACSHAPLTSLQRTLHGTASGCGQVSVHVLHCKQHNNAAHHPLIIVNDVCFNVPAVLQTRTFRRGSARVRPSSGDCGQVSQRALHCKQHSTALLPFSF